MKRVDGAPHAKADPFGHLRKVDHVVSQEDEHRTRAIEDLRRKQEEQGEQISAILETINQLLAPEPMPPKRRIGFQSDDANPD